MTDRDILLDPHVGCYPLLPSLWLINSTKGMISWEWMSLKAWSICGREYNFEFPGSSTAPKSGEQPTH